MTAPDPLAALKFITACDLADARTGVDCENRGRWTALVHAHDKNGKSGPQRVVLCDVHVTGFAHMEQSVVKNGHGICPMCHTTLTPGQVMTDLEEL